MHWQLQEAEQRFSEVLRCAHRGGAQFVSRHGEDVAVVLGIEEYRQLSGSDFKSFLRSGPPLDDLALTRSGELPRDIDFPADA
ncbi:prevent-host-death family protein [Saccharopolyspora lacisalsi]|uniref:Antitoxin n=1 Tax=Halosaccharopolyspora lacisalsi TaxID=1000566 RepID=A0A839DUH8_9PSEU|nr:prevent-host-death family protein [Halosaccharopolyspora lacisalsi]